MTDQHSLVDQELAGFRIEKRIGAGSTGVVYQASRDGESYAIKVLDDAFAKLKPLRRRFDRESRALQRLEHEHIVSVLETGVDAGHAFLVMELLVGQTLEDRLQEGSVNADEALRWAREALAALAYAHEQKIIHRDMKPANIFLSGEDKSVKLLDFGLAKFLSVDELSAEGALTRRGKVVGTPAYLAPEQVIADDMDQRADVYSVGVVLYELLADRRPFDYKRKAQMLRAHLNETPPPLAEACPGIEIAPELEAVIMRALEKEPEDRFSDASEMLAALQAFDADAVTLPAAVPSRTERPRTPTPSEVITGAERDQLARQSAMEEMAATIPQPPSGEQTLEDEAAPVAETTDQPVVEVAAEPTPGEAAEAEEKARRQARAADVSSETVKLEREPQAWVTALVWCAGLAGLAAIIGIVYYATTLG